MFSPSLSPPLSLFLSLPLSLTSALPPSLSLSLSLPPFPPVLPPPCLFRESDDVAGVGGGGAEGTRTEAEMRHLERGHFSLTRSNAYGHRSKVKSQWSKVKEKKQSKAWAEVESRVTKSARHTSGVKSEDVGRGVRGW
eukprot:81618-Rhodomonas_salina.1